MEILFTIWFVGGFITLLIGTWNLLFTDSMDPIWTYATAFASIWPLLLFVVAYRVLKKFTKRNIIERKNNG